MADSSCVSGHTVFVTDRGGQRRMGEIGDIEKVAWGRIRDDISSAKVTLNGRSCLRQADFLGQIEPGRHEIVVFRGSERVWEGPITLTKYTRDSMEIKANDVGHYLYRTAMQDGYSNAYPNVTEVTTRIDGIIRAGFCHGFSSVLIPVYRSWWHDTR